MFKKTTIAALVGVAAAMSAMPAQAFVISSGDYKMIVDGYVNGTVYPAGGIGPICTDVATCDTAAVAPAVGGVGSEDSWGIISVSSITNTTTNTTMFSRGVDGYLIGAVTGLTDFFSFGLFNIQRDYATGGTINLYKSATDYNPAAPSSASQAAVVASVTTLPLYLGLNFVVGAGNGGFDVAGAAATAATYISNFDASTFTGNGSGYLEVTGGDAAGHFDTNTLTTWAGLSADASFSVTLTPITPNDAGYGNWLVGSSSDVKGYAIPEPGSMALAGLGLMGLAALRRRKQQA
jgi:hypothetical protein